MKPDLAGRPLTSECVPCHRDTRILPRTARDSRDARCPAGPSGPCEKGQSSISPPCISRKIIPTPAQKQELLSLSFSPFPVSSLPSVSPFHWTGIPFASRSGAKAPVAQSDFVAVDLLTQGKIWKDYLVSFECSSVEESSDPGETDRCGICNRSASSSWTHTPCPRWVCTHPTTPGPRAGRAPTLVGSGKPQRRKKACFTQLEELLSFFLLWSFFLTS